MTQRKTTTGYVTEPREVDGATVYAVLREYTYRGVPGTQWLGNYSTPEAAEKVRAALAQNGSWEV